ncbi:hypothetical protein N665_3154s0005 [Sinapis alba]|nr:hypothetical protein N665_3154s0005 [Sinapis alba]
MITDGFHNEERSWKRRERGSMGTCSKDTSRFAAKEAVNIFPEKGSYRELSEIAEQAKRRVEIARLRELHTLKGHVESVVKLKGLDIETPGQYTV